MVKWAGGLARGFSAVIARIARFVQDVDDEKGMVQESTPHSRGQVAAHLLRFTALARRPQPPVSNIRGCRRRQLRSGYDQDCDGSVVVVAAVVELIAPRSRVQLQLIWLTK